MNPNHTPVTLENLGLNLPRLLIPRPNISLKEWAIIACDQFTSEPEVWNQLHNQIGSKPSTLHCILPECFLGKPDQEDRIHRLHRTMEQYVQEGIILETEPGIMLVERTTPFAQRRGVLLALDLENYDFSLEAKPLIRPTEQTVMERLPPRLKIRKGALLEFPHTLVLVNDRNHPVIDPLFTFVQGQKPTYETDLLLEAGSLRGWFLPAFQVEHLLKTQLEKNFDKESFLYAVGDGNHSLAAAKLHWEEIKANSSLPNLQHPARYTLVEVISLYNPGIRFEPIHRIVTPASVPGFLSLLHNTAEVQVHPESSFEALQRWVMKSSKKEFVFGISSQTSHYGIKILHPKDPTPIETAQKVLDLYCHEHAEAKIDYIHGEQTFVSLTRQEMVLGVFLPPFPKEHLFPYIEQQGILPRKAFSIGEALEKRFYLEGRRIRP
ncbi:MAG: DUF1015 domain-containing protein [Spirochaetales bacterium]